METYKILAAKKFNHKITSRVLSLKVEGIDSTIVIHKDVMTLIEKSNQRRKNKIKMSIMSSGNVLIEFLDKLIEQDKVKKQVRYKYNTVEYVTCPC